MKIYYSLFALSAAAPAMGFVANKAPAAFSTTLNVGSREMNGYGSTLDSVRYWIGLLDEVDFDLVRLKYSAATRMAMTQQAAA